MTKANGIAIKECVEGDKRVMLAIPATGDKARTIRISLKQWRMFHAVVDSNGFVEAAEKLHMSQSAISHALAKLQEHLGVALLTLKGRRAQITEEGKVLLERSRELLRHAVELEDLAENLRLGWGPEIRLIIACPARILRFRAKCPVECPGSAGGSRLSILARQCRRFRDYH
jgi:DNA-binding transcriptional ArsR family regulator